MAAEEGAVAAAAMQQTAQQAATLFHDVAVPCSLAAC
jgi:hypothetical protein